MVHVKPMLARSTITESTDGLQICIPSRKNPFMIAFLCVWLVGWAFGEVAASSTLLSPPGDSSGPVLFMIVWLAGWTMGGAFCIYTVLWSLAGRELVVLRPDMLVVRREVLGIGRTKEYELMQVRNLRVASVPYNPFDFKSGLQFWGIGGGLVAFDYGAGTIRFAGGVQEGEAVDIVKRLASRHSFGGSSV